MNTLYYYYVIMGKRTLTSVPISRQNAVKQMLIDNGFTINQDGTVSRKN